MSIYLNLLKPDITHNLRISISKTVFRGKYRKKIIPLTVLCYSGGWKKVVIEDLLSLPHQCYGSMSSQLDPGEVTEGLFFQFKITFEVKLHYLPY